jgi:hypothetical protein
VPYSPRSLWTITPLGYFVTFVGNRYAIDLRIPAAVPTISANDPPPFWRENQPVISIRRDVRLVPISAAEHPEQRDFLDNRLNNMRGTAAARLLRSPE